MQKNYSKFSNKFKKQENEVVETPVEETVVEAQVKEPTERLFNPNPATVEESTIQNYIKTAVVIGCEKLNLRKDPSLNSEVLCVLKKGEKVEVDLKIEGEPKVGDASFYQVCTVAGVKGYCMTKYISIE